ncbi:MAG: M50 family metallopeptidase [Defluviitaleaceae bacterium]|nr:M50 family metallopeptidase [Defluviitaleaceae bacterium]
METKKGKIKWERILLFIASAVLGGIVAYLSLASVRISVPAERVEGMKIITWLALVLSAYMALYISVFIHEIGHLVFGLIDGYKFVSLSVSNIMLVKENGKLKIKKFTLAGMGGQCLMSPPPFRNNTYPFMLYNLGGGLMNFIFCAIFAAFFLELKEIFPFSGVVFIPLICVGLIFGGIINLLPIKIGGPATDGHNAVSLRKNKEARRALWLILTINSKIASGERIKDFPAKWFEFPDDYDFSVTTLGNVATMGLGRLIDCRDFVGAKALAEKILDKGGGLVELLKNETRCELLFLEIIANYPKGTDEIERLYTPELKEYINASKTHLSKHRLMYAYEKLISLDTSKAEIALEAFHKTCRTFPYRSICEGELELIGIVNELARAST